MLNGEENWSRSHSVQKLNSVWCRLLHKARRGGGWSLLFHSLHRKGNFCCGAACYECKFHSRMVRNPVYVHLIYNCVSLGTWSKAHWNQLKDFHWLPWVFDHALCYFIFIVILSKCRATSHESKCLVSSDMKVYSCYKIVSERASSVFIHVCILLKVAFILPMLLIDRVWS